MTLYFLFGERSRYGPVELTINVRGSLDPFPRLQGVNGRSINGKRKRTRLFSKSQLFVSLTSVYLEGLRHKDVQPTLIGTIESPVLYVPSTGKEFRGT